MSAQIPPVSTVVALLTQNPKIQGLTPTTYTGKEGMAKNITSTFWGQLESWHVLNTNSLAYLATPEAARLKVIIVSLLLYSISSSIIINKELLLLVVVVLFLDTRKLREKEKFETIFSVCFDLFLSQMQWCSTLCLI